MPIYSGDPTQLREGGGAGNGPAHVGLAWPVRGALLPWNIQFLNTPLPSPCTHCTSVGSPSAHLSSWAAPLPTCPRPSLGPGSLLGQGPLQLPRRTPPPATQTPLASDSLSPLKQIITAGPRVSPQSTLAWMPDGEAPTRSAS